MTHEQIAHFLLQDGQSHNKKVLLVQFNAICDAFELQKATPPLFYKICRQIIKEAPYDLIVEKKNGQERYQLINLANDGNKLACILKEVGKEYKELRPYFRAYKLLRTKATRCCWKK